MMRRSIEKKFAKEQQMRNQLLGYNSPKQILSPGLLMSKSKSKRSSKSKSSSSSSSSNSKSSSKKSTPRLLTATMRLPTATMRLPAATLRLPTVTPRLSMPMLKTRTKKTTTRRQPSIVDNTSIKEQDILNYEEELSPLVAESSSSSSSLPPPYGSPQTYVEYALPIEEKI